MLVDDDNFCNKMSAFVLQQQKAASRISAYTTGEDALAYLKQAVEAQQIQNFPDVLLLDLNMHRLSGWDLLEEFSAFPDRYREKMSIYVLTSSIMRSDKEMAAQNPDVTGYIEKPFTSEELEYVLSLESARESK